MEKKSNHPPKEDHPPTENNIRFQGHSSSKEKEGAHHQQKNAESKNQHFELNNQQNHNLESSEDDSSEETTTKKSGKKNISGGGRRKINIEFIENKSRRHVTFSKRKAGLIKKAYELSTLTGTQVLLLIASETGNVYTFATPKLQPLITKAEGKSLIQSCLNPEMNHITSNPNLPHSQSNSNESHSQTTSEIPKSAPLNPFPPSERKEKPLPSSLLNNSNIESSSQQNHMGSSSSTSSSNNNLPSSKTMEPFPTSYSSNTLNSSQSFFPPFNGPIRGFPTNSFPHSYPAPFPSNSFYSHPPYSQNRSGQGD